jgi:hypothetical protein
VASHLVGTLAAREVLRQVLTAVAVAAALVLWVLREPALAAVLVVLPFLTLCRLVLLSRMPVVVVVRVTLEVLPVVALALAREGQGLLVRRRQRTPARVGAEPLLVETLLAALAARALSSFALSQVSAVLAPARLAAPRRRIRVMVRTVC